MWWGVIRKAAVQSLLLLLLFAVCYRVVGHWPHTATWVVLGSVLLGGATYRAWREASAKDGRRP